jgi:hypothetical protein
MLMEEEAFSPTDADVRVGQRSALRRAGAIQDMKVKSSQA